MQWFIDIIKELVHGQLGYFDRGDPGGIDWRRPNFTRDNAWHVLDLSGVVPADARAVSFHLVLESLSINQAAIFRMFGNVGATAIAEGTTIVSAQPAHFDFSVSCDSGRKIEYKISADPWTTINLTIKGWWLR